ncbi:MAG: carboxypeptidase regulatory-like domain-containing protein [Nannocystis sp.]|nr:hypothetical protein [Nannocystis sp.]MBA3547957.1 carboxypeptidase regulatory-like domain-containing protein [Nannocystis sp.]
MPRRTLLLLSALSTACTDSGGRETSVAATLTTPGTLSDPGSSSGDASSAASEAPTTGTTGMTGMTGMTGTTGTDASATDPVVTTGESGTTADATTGSACVGLECQVPACPDAGTTTLRGTVFAPEGTLPLYNVVVYVPNGPLDPISDGVTCDTCQTALSGKPLTATLSDTKGEFVLSDVPAGENIPLVLTIGKWRRSVVIPQVLPCVDNLVGADLTHLPRNQSEGHIPRIAMVTGGADALECLLRKVGLDDAEFTPEAGPGRVNLFAGKDGGNKFVAEQNGGMPFAPAANLWNDPGRLKNYDLVMMNCEGTTDGGNKSGAARENIVDYAGIGGRLFLSHWQNVWIESGAAPFPSAATFKHQNDLASPFTAKLETGFPKGMALAEWLVNVGGSTQLGEISIKAGQNTIAAVNPEVSTRWIYGENPTSVQYFTFNAPIEAAEDARCGRVVDTDIHVSSGDTPGKAFPGGCTTDELSPQEKALIFMLFELSSCIIPDDEPPVIPG